MGSFLQVAHGNVLATDNTARRSRRGLAARYVLSIEHRFRIGGRGVVHLVPGADLAIGKWKRTRKLGAVIA